MASVWSVVTELLEATILEAVVLLETGVGALSAHAKSIIAIALTIKVIGFILQIIIYQIYIA